MPLIGLSVHSQHFVIKHGNQSIPPTGPFSGLNSTYRAMWRGPFAGFDFDYSRKTFTLSGLVEYHYAFYTAEADWNMRSDLGHLRSFEQSARGFGFVSGLLAEYGLSESWFLNIAANVQYWQARDGVDRTFLASGATSTTRLNEVNWNSKDVMIGVKYKI